jgi:hypothetical protein
MFFGFASRLVSLCPCSAYSRSQKRFALPLAISSVLIGGGELVAGDSKKVDSKHIIGATAKLTETLSGLSFMARIDTGAKSCSLHVEEIEIKNESKPRVRNVGKAARVLLKDAEGNTEWIDTKIVAAVRVKSSALKLGEFDHRYKVRLTLTWNDFEKTVLVTLNDRTDMEYPLLIGRNFLRGDFLVDVAKEE